MILNPQNVSFARYKNFCRKTECSLLRCMQYEILDGIQTPGKVLDIGGTHDPRKQYKQLLKEHTEYLVCNLPHNYGWNQPDIQADCNAKLPFDDNYFDHVVSFNTMEHIYNFEFAVEEMFRVVKSGGKLLLHIPFLFPVHDDPDDFHRPTASWWHKKFERFGVPDDKIRVTPLAWCPLSSAISLMDNKWSKIQRKMFRPLYLLPALLRNTCRKIETSRLAKDMPLGYFIEVIK